MSKNQNIETNVKFTFAMDVPEELSPEDEVMLVYEKLGGDNGFIKWVLENKKYKMLHEGVGVVKAKEILSTVMMRFYVPPQHRFEVN